MIKIRLLSAGEAKDVSALIRGTLTNVNKKHLSPHVLNYMLRRFTPQRIEEISRERDVYVALKGSKIVGTASIAEDGHIGTVFVDHRHIHEGIGTKLLTHLEKIAKNRRLKRVKLHATHSAARFYQRLGYLQGKKNTDKRFGTTYRMEKTLSLSAGTKKRIRCH